MRDIPNAQRILVISAAGLGDFVLGTPALRAIRQRFPLARIWILTIPEVGPLAQRCPYVDEVRTLDLRHSRSGLAWVLGSRRREFWRLVRELRALRLDIAINLYQVGTRCGGLRMAVFLKAIAAGLTVGRDSGGRGVGFDWTSAEEGHEADAQLAVARLLGASPAGDVPELWVRDEDRRECIALLARHGISEADPLACIQAGSAQPQKRWPRDRFAVVGRRLSGAGARVLLIGNADEGSLCRWLSEAIPGAVSLAGETTLPLLAALLQRSALLVTNDSGPMHMAAALGVPLVVTFGPHTPNRFAPRGKAMALVFAATEPPGGGPWWEAIAADAVAEAAVGLFVEHSRRPRATA